MARYQLPTRLPEPFSGIFKVMGFGSGATLQIDSYNAVHRKWRQSH